MLCFLLIAREVEQAVKLINLCKYYVFLQGNARTILRHCLDILKYNYKIPKRRTREPSVKQIVFDETSQILSLEEFFLLKTN